MDSDILQDIFPSPRATPLPVNVSDGESEGPTLALQDVNYYVQYRTGRWWQGACFRQQHVKRVLSDVNLAFPAGQVVALVGSSGSGKTSLLDVIAHRTSGTVTGFMTYNGRRCTKDMMQQRMSYVIQADRLLPNLTVRETLTYTAYLKLPGYVMRTRIEDTVDSVINRMGLRAVADSRVGGAVVRGVSGGEKRRVTIAIQLLKDPDILLLDEPTTGLDSFTARHLVTSLQQLAKQGRLVILSIHQPRYDIVKLLDRTALMCQGQVLFYGATTELVPYFTELGYPCPTYANPLDTYIDVVSIDRRNMDSQMETSRRVHELHEAYSGSDLLADNRRKVAEQVNATSPLVEANAAGSRRVKSPGWFRVFSTVTSRMNLNLYRDRKAFVNRCVLLPLFVPFIIIFLGRLRNNQNSIQDRIGLLYQSVQVPPYVGIIHAVGLFPQLRNHFYREGLDGLYTSSTFLLSYTFHILPFVAVSSIIFSSSLYWITGMNSEVDHFAMYVAVAFCLHLSGELLAVGCMGVFQNPQLANSTTALLLTASGLLASGFLRTTQNMIDVLQYMGWMSIHKYSSEILVANEFHKLNLTCEKNPQGLPCMTDGDMFLKKYYPDALDNVNRNFELLAVFTVGILFLAMISFKVVGLKILQ
ncbi:ATP-binding cassette sub-family G member 5-like [Babylonia areolata]|uniref:ATP-binding cassette sub-family G member 5-like n=1 Tax=Babylonia areolata TaxID=304850 RepID=UPI003FD11A95